MTTIIDLTAPITEDMANVSAHGRSPIFLPGTRMSHEESADTWRGKGVDDVSVMNGFVLLAEHNGTHVDAPLHLDPEGPSIDEVPLQKCHGSAVWLDVSTVGAREAIGPALLEESCEDAGVTIEPGDIVLLYTGWDRHLPDDQETYLSDHPGLSGEGASWLHRRDIDFVGIDCGNIDVAGDVSFPAHKVFLERDLPDRYTLVAEHLRDISSIPEHRFTFSAAPLPLDSATASPVRAYATVE